MTGLLAVGVMFALHFCGVGVGAFDFHNRQFSTRRNARERYGADDANDVAFGADVSD